MTRPILFFLHGWGYDSTYWDGCIPLSLSHRRGDLGFFGAEPSSYPEEPFIGIGHSMAFLKMLLDWPVQMKALIGINGFACFCQSETHPHGVPTFVLERMKMRLQTEPARLLADFWAKNNHPGPKGRPVIARLDQALDFLISEDGRQQLALTEPRRILFLAGGKDPIVQIKQDDLSSHPIHWRPESGHHLIHSDRDWCWERINHFVAHHV